MNLSDTISSAEDRFNEAVETGRTRLQAVVDTTEQRVEKGSGLALENLDIARGRFFDDLERAKGYAVDSTSWIAERVPSVELPLADALPSVEELATRWFDTTEKFVAWQKDMTMEILGAISKGKAPAKKASTSTAKKSTKAGPKAA